MPYKDKEKQKAFQRNHYNQHIEDYRKRSKDYKDQLREWVFDIKKTLECKKCGEKDPYCIDFHHTNPLEKDKSVSQMVRLGMKRERILEEIDKCIPLCSNCHRKVHGYGDSYLLS